MPRSGRATDARCPRRAAPRSAPNASSPCRRRGGLPTATAPRRRRRARSTAAGRSGSRCAAGDRAARIIRLAARRQDMRLTEPVLLLDAAGDAEPLVQRLEIGGVERRQLLEVADAELVELASARRCRCRGCASGHRSARAPTGCAAACSARRPCWRRRGRRGRRQRRGLGELRHRHAAIDAARIIRLAARRQDLRLAEPVLLLDAALGAEPVVEAFDIGGGQARRDPEKRRMPSSLSCFCTIVSMPRMRVRSSLGPAPPASGFTGAPEPVVTEMLEMGGAGGAAAGAGAAARSSGGRGCGRRLGPRGNGRSHRCRHGDAVESRRRRRGPTAR